MTALGRRARWRDLLGLAAAALLLVWVLAEVDARATWEVLSSAHPGWLLAAVVLGALQNTAQSAALFAATLRGVGVAVPYPVVLGATVGNLAIQAMVPVGLGHAGRAAWLVRAQGVPLRPAVRATVLVLVFKLQAVALLAAGGWAMLSEATPWQVGVALAVGAFAAFGVPAVWAGVYWALWRRRSQSAALHPTPLAEGMAHAAGIVAVEVVIFSACCQAVGVWPGLVQVGAMLPLAAVGARLPLTPMGVGTREVLVVALLSPYAPGRWPARRHLAALADHPGAPRAGGHSVYPPLCGRHRRSGFRGRRANSLILVRAGTAFTQHFVGELVARLGGPVGKAALEAHSSVCSPSTPSSTSR